MLTLFTFTETTPGAAGTVASSQPVSGSVGPPGIATGQLDDYSALYIDASLVGATGGTLDVFLQNSPDQGATWFDYAHFTQLAAGGGAVTAVASVAIGAQNLTLSTVGKNLSPALAAGTVLGGAWGDRFRLVFVAGGGTSAGAAIVVRICGQRLFNWRP
jgi:hypothetical protein